MVEFSSLVLRVFIVTKVKEITEASGSVGLLLATAVFMVISSRVEPYDRAMAKFYRS